MLTMKGQAKSRELLSKRELTTGEKVILLRSSKLNGFKFPPWTSPPAPSDFESQAGQDKYLYVSSYRKQKTHCVFFRLLTSSRDDAEFRLSKTQLEVFDGWRRPGEALNPPNGSQIQSPSMLAEGKLDLVQDVTSDCSVVASLCAVTARRERGHSDVMSKFSIFFRVG